MKPLKKLFAFPLKEFDSKEDELNFKFAWNLSFYTMLLTTSLAVVFAFIQHDYLINVIIGSAITIICHFLLRFSKDYKVFTFCYSLASVLFFGFTMFTQHHILHLVEYAWMFMIIAYAFTLSRIEYALIIFFLICIIITFHLLFFFERNLLNFKEGMTSDNIWGNLIPILLGFVAFGYTLWQHVKIRELVKRDLKKTNINLGIRNELIQEQKTEKEIMLKEIHHRVKNNLQIISSLLRLQSNQVENPEVKKIFQESVHRIRSIALIHEKLYQSTNLAKINYEDYLIELINEILHSLDSKQNVDFSVNTNLDKIGNRTIVPMALIFNELITNSVKHAFINVENPKIEVALNGISKNRFAFVYSDNGNWKDKNLTMKSIGLDLIGSFTEQLDGTVERITENEKTEYRFELSIID